MDCKSTVGSFLFCVVRVALSPIKNRRALFLFLNVALSMPFFADAIVSQKNILFNLGITYMLFAVINMMAAAASRVFTKSPRALIIKKIISVLFSILIILISFVGLVQTFLMQVFHCGFSAYIFHLLNETNPSESREFLATYLFTSTVFRILAIFLIICAVLYLAIYIISSKSTVHRLVSFALSLVIIVSVFFSALHIRYMGKNFKLGYDACKYLRYNPVFSCVNAIYQFLDDMTDFKAICTTSTAYDENGTAFSTNNDSLNVILVVGESFNKYHSSLYGYPLNTNPILQEQDMYVFNDIVSCSNSTSVCMKYLLSCAEVSRDEKWYDYPLVPSVFRKAGFHVNFWSNQFVQSANSDPWESAASFLNLPEVSVHSFDNRNTEKYRYDEELVDSYLQNAEDLESYHKNLVIFHLMGSHIVSRTRYPDSFQILSEDDYSRPDIPEEEISVIADYDNSIIYNDYVVSKIVDSYMDKNSVIVYVPDHGDEVNDFRIHRGRSFDFMSVGAPVFHNQLDVPLLIWMSEEYSSRYPQIKEMIQSSLDRPFVTDKLSHLLFTLSFISNTFYNPKKDLINIEYDLGQSRLVINPENGECLDYDEYCSIN